MLCLSHVRHTLDKHEHMTNALPVTKIPKEKGTQNSQKKKETQKHVFKHIFIFTYIVIKKKITI